MPSWQARIVSSLTRLYMKRHPTGDEMKNVRFLRSRIKTTKFLRQHVPKAANVEQIDDGQVRGEWVSWSDSPHPTIYYLHGGGYVAGSPASHRALTLALSRVSRSRVFALDYRLAPEAPFPAAIEDAVEGYRWLIKNGERPENIIIGGDSAGGGLTMATLIALRDAGAPLPLAGFCLSPWADLTVTGQSVITNNNRDVMFYGEAVRKMAPVYLADASPDHPLASPIYADLSQLPPLLIYASNSEVLLDDSLRLADRARGYGVKVDLRIWDDLPHVWPVFVRFKLPEAAATVSEIADFIRQQVETKSPARSVA